MSVTIKWRGSAGNNFFEYFTALIYCNKNNLTLLTKPNRNMNKVLKINHINIKNNLDNLNTQRITDKDFDKNNELKYYGKKKYIFCSYFQNCNYVNNNFDIIKKYIDVNYFLNKINFIPNNISDNDILFIVRLGNHKHNGHNSEIIHPEYYLKILKNNNFDNIYFLIHPSSNISKGIQFDKNIDKTVKEYLEFFNKYKDKIKFIEKRNPLIDFYIVNYFKNIAISNSTFNWWSVYVSNINDKKIYSPKYFGYFGVNKMKCHGIHIKNLWNIHNKSIPIEHKFINMGVWKKS